MTEDEKEELLELYFAQIQSPVPMEDFVRLCKQYETTKSYLPDVHTPAAFFQKRDADLNWIAQCIPVTLDKLQLETLYNRLEPEDTLFLRQPSRDDGHGINQLVLVAEALFYPGFTPLYQLYDSKPYAIREPEGAIHLKTFLGIYEQYRATVKANGAISYEAFLDKREENIAWIVDNVTWPLTREQAEALYQVCLDPQEIPYFRESEEVAEQTIAKLDRDAERLLYPDSDRLYALYESKPYAASEAFEAVYKQFTVRKRQAPNITLEGFLQAREQDISWITSNISWPLTREQAEAFYNALDAEDTSSSHVGGERCTSHKTTR